MSAESLPPIGTSTGPAHGPWIRSLVQSASRFTTPFFPPLRGRPSAQLGRFHFSLLRLLPELSQLGLEVGPRGLIVLGKCFVCQRALAPGTP